MTVKEIKAALDAAGIEYESGMRKADLQALLPDGNSSTQKPAGKKTRNDSNIVIAVSLTTADGVEHECRSIEINNPRGCMPAHKATDPDYIMKSVRETLSKRFGAQHVR